MTSPYHGSKISALQPWIDRLRVVPNFSSRIVERAKRERAWKSPHARKGDTRVAFSRVGWFSRALTFRSLYYLWGKMGTTGSLMNRELTKRRRLRQRERQNSNRFWLAKQQLGTSIFLVHFLVVVGRLRHKAPALWSTWPQHKNVLFLFLNLDTALSDTIPDNFANIWQVKWNWIRWMKFETVRIHF